MREIDLRFYFDKDEDKNKIITLAWESHLVSVLDLFESDEEPVQEVGAEQAAAEVGAEQPTGEVNEEPMIEEHIVEEVLYDPLEERLAAWKRKLEEFEPGLRELVMKEIDEHIDYYCE